MLRLSIINRENNDAYDSWKRIINKLNNKFEKIKLTIDIIEYLYRKNFKIFPQYFFLCS